MVEVRTFASQDEKNPSQLCRDRANNVMNELIGRYKVNRTQIKGLIFGPTDQLSKETGFNRVITFNDNNKK